MSPRPPGWPASPKDFMRLALRLARRGEGHVSPNPMVGAVLVREGRVVATGCHRAVGHDHAEVAALRKVEFCAEGCDLYVNLEPCCHHGRTPPCTEALLQSGVRRVFVATTDPNPLVSGCGIEALQKGGVEVEVGLLEAEARRLNAPFFRWITTGMPFVTLKMAATLDGRIAQRNGLSRWITSEPARKVVHKLRSVSDAVVVGARTALQDDPMLLPALVRRPPRIPWRVVVDEEARLPVDSRLVRTAREGPVVVACTKAASEDCRASLQERGVEVWVLPAEGGLVSLPALMRELGQRSCQNLLVEGGATLAASFLEAGLVDRLLVFYAPLILADPEAVPLTRDLGLRSLSDAVRFTQRFARRVGPDLMVEWELDREGRAGLCSPGSSRRSEP